MEDSISALKNRMDIGLIKEQLIKNESLQDTVVVDVRIIIRQ
ncbi:MAG: hypothetical protein ACXAEU_26040 [Candidatus Hodarchaeales archaeon]